MNQRIYRLTRDVKVTECDWLNRDYKKGEKVVRFTGYTYGCISPTGMPCSIDGDIPFFELPKDSLECIQS